MPPSPIVPLCSICHHLQLCPRVPTFPSHPDLKPKMVGGVGQTRDYGYLGPRLPFPGEAEAQMWGAKNRLRLGPCLPSSRQRRDWAGVSIEKILQNCTPKAKLGQNEEGAVFSLNVALNLALVPSNTMSIHLVKPPGQLDSLLWPRVPFLTLNTSARGQDTELE